MSTPGQRRLLLLALALAVVGCDGQPGPSAPDGEEDLAADVQEVDDGEGRSPGGANRRTVYVPAYSHLGTRNRTLFSVTLSVRNVDPGATITLTQVSYHDTMGRRVRRYLDQPRSMGPLETAEFSVETFDDAGGSGANFLVDWEGPAGAHPLLTETVMIGHVGTAYVAFTSRGVELDRPPTLVPGATNVADERAEPTPDEGEPATDEP